jgi:hypothetical protein
MLVTRLSAPSVIIHAATDDVLPETHRNVLAVKFNEAVWHLTTSDFLNTT